MSLISCSGETKDYFTYRRFPLTLTAGASVFDTRDGETTEYEISLTMTDGLSGTLEFLPPAALGGLRVSVNLASENDSVMEYDGLSIPTAYGIAQLCEAAVSVFSLTDGEMVSAEVGDDGNTAVSYRRDDADFSVTMTPEGSLIAIKITVPENNVKYPCIAGSEITFNAKSLNYGG